MTPALARIPSSAPDQADASTAQTALPRLRDYLNRHASETLITFRVEGDGEDTLVIPREAAELFARILAHMAAGEGVSVVPAHAELTTQQAADVLNVSRPYLIKLLDSGAIEYRLVGTHRRVRFDSLMEYARKDDQKRRKAADELSAMTQEMGLI